MPIQHKLERSIHNLMVKNKIRLISALYMALQKTHIIVTKKLTLVLFDQCIHDCKHPRLLMNTYCILDIVHDMGENIHKYCLPGRQRL